MLSLYETGCEVLGVDPRVIAAVRAEEESRARAAALQEAVRAARAEADRLTREATAAKAREAAWRSAFAGLVLIGVGYLGWCFLGGKSGGAVVAPSPVRQADVPTTTTVTAAQVQPAPGGST